MSSRDSMETLPAGDPDTTIEILDGRSNAKRADLKKKDEDTNQDGLFQKLGSQSFETVFNVKNTICLLYTSPSPRDRTRSRMPSSA